MIPALAPIFRGPLEAIGANLVLDDDPRPFLPGAALLDEDRLRELLAAFGRGYAARLAVPGICRRRNAGGGDAMVEMAFLGAGAAGADREHRGGLAAADGLSRRPASCSRRTTGPRPLRLPAEGERRHVRRRP